VSDRVRALFVTYCFGENAGQTLVGVYKRGLRIALELSERGHEVLFDCTGRTEYRDELTSTAEQRLRFVDLRLANPASDPLGRQNGSVRAMAACKPDLVVVGEAPLAGTLLEATLCAVELGIPVALLDNAYNDSAAEQYLHDHGGMVDGVVLTGPSCTHSKSPPRHLCQVSPFVTPAQGEAEELLAQLGLHGERLISVLAYDRKAERLGFSLLERLDAPGTDFVFMARRREECKRRTAGLPAELRTRVRVLGLPPDSLLFGLIELSSLAVVKYGFMQVSECLALHTPVICAYHEGPTWVGLLPPACSPFIHVAEQDEADDRTLAAARKLLDIPADAMRPIHSGGFDASAGAADFLERLAGQRQETWSEAVAKFPEEQVRAALQARVGRSRFDLLQLRAMRLRSLRGEELYSIVCRYRINGGERFLRLWGRRFSSSWGVRRRRLDAVRSGQRVLYASPRQRVLIESDAGQALLPPLP
jgi:hypothetical protein